MVAMESTSMAAVAAASNRSGRSICSASFAASHGSGWAAVGLGLATVGVSVSATALAAAAASGARRGRLAEFDHRGTPGGWLQGTQM